MSVKKLGHHVQDRVSGILGICVYYSESLYSVSQIGIQPISDNEEKPVESFEIDLPQADFLPMSSEDKEDISWIPAPQKSKFKLGGAVVDTVTGMQGIAAYRVWYLNGCLRVGVAPTEVDLYKENTLDIVWLPEARLEKLTKTKMTDKLKAALDYLKPKEKPASGGPSHGAMRSKTVK